MKIKSSILTIGSILLSTSFFAQESEVIQPKPNFFENLSAFYIILGIILLLMVTINVLSLAFKGMIKKTTEIIPLEKRSERIGKILSEFNKMIIVALLLFIATYVLSNLKLTFTLPGTTNEKTPWLQVHRSDLWFFVGIIVIEISIVFFLMRSFKKALILHWRSEHN
jgi:hypothetical protein